jgi:hypothetical protein
MARLWKEYGSFFLKSLFLWRIDMLVVDNSLESTIFINDGFKLKIIIIDNPPIARLDELQKQYLLSLRGKRMNDLPFAGAYLKNKCILEDVILYDNIVEYKFNLESETIKSNDNMPVKVVVNQKVECRHLLNINALVLLFSDIVYIKDISKMVASIPEALYLRVNPGNELKYYNPKISEVKLEPLDLEIMKSFFFTFLRVNRNDEFKNDIFDISNFLIESPLEKQNFQIKTSIRTNGKKVLFACKGAGGIRNKLIIRSNGEVQCTAGISSKLIIEIIKVVFLLLRASNAGEFLASFEGSLEEFFESIHKDMEEEAKSRQKRLILYEIIDFLDAFRSDKLIRSDLSITYITVMLNILIKRWMSWTTPTWLIL